MSSLSDYDVGAVLGSGAFATVNACTKKSDGSRYALKLAEKGHTDQDAAKHEIKLLTTVGIHKNVVSLVDHFETANAWAFVLELAEGGEVFDRICEKGAYSEADAANVIRQITLALAHLHAIGVCHRDLKPENLLLTATNDIKVADFGLAALCGEGAPPMTQVCGTVVYMAPEMIANLHGKGPRTPYTTAVDMFSLGGIVFTLLGAYVPFDPLCELGDDDVQQRILSNKWSFDDYPDVWANVSDGAKALIRSLLEPDAATRVTAEALLHSNTWVSGETASDKPLPGSNNALAGFNNGRRVWRAAIAATQLFVHNPLAVTSAAQKATTLPEAAESELRTAFELYDLDGDGSITISELKQVFRSLGSSSAQADRMLEEADTSGDGTISFDEFKKLSLASYSSSGDALRKVFDYFDADGSGFIDRAELSVMLRKLGFGWQGSGIFKAADTDGDGKVSFAEFCALCGEVQPKHASKGEPTDAPPSCATQ
jgi:calcium-dependent protein kinase